MARPSSFDSCEIISLPALMLNIADNQYICTDSWSHVTEHNTQVIYAKFGVWTRPYVLSEHAGIISLPNVSFLN